MARANPIDRFEFERVLWAQGLNPLPALGGGARAMPGAAGGGEGARGPLPGPVFAPPAVLPSKWAASGLPHELEGLNDSKQLTAAQREKFFAFLTACPEVQFAIAQVGAGQIDAINILRATHRAMNDALAQLSPAPEHALVDGRPVK